MKTSLHIKTPFVISLSFIGVLTLCAAFFLKHSFSVRTQVNHDLEVCLQEAQGILSTSKVAPTNTNVSKFKIQQTQIQKQYDDLLALLDTASTVQTNLTPLEFKEELLKTQQLLTERANLWNIKLPLSLGFPEFEGGNIPSQAEIPPLSLQLDTLRTLVNLLIESKVQEISLLSKKELRNIDLIKDKAMYKVLLFEIAFKSSMENLRTFLHKVSSSNHLFIIRKINIESDKENRISVNMAVDAVKLKKSGEGN